MDFIIDNLRKSYGRRKILDGVSLSASSGECIGILGKNGCGKSTLLSVIAGVSSSDGGEILLRGTDIGKCIGYVPQGTPLFEELSAEDNLRLWYKKDELRSSLDTGVCAKLGINEFIKVPVRKMSGGMKKRVSICCAMANDPVLLLLDEPTAALDIPCKQIIFDYLNECKKQGKIILLTTHSADELELCDKLYILKDGTAKEFTYNGNTKELAESL